MPPDTSQGVQGEVASRGATTGIDELAPILPKLKSLDIRGNLLTQLPKALSESGSLRILDVRDNEITELPVAWAKWFAAVTSGEAGPVCIDDPDGQVAAFGGCAAILNFGCDTDMGSISPAPMGTIVKVICPASCGECPDSDSEEYVHGSFRFEGNPIGQLL